MTNAYLTMFTVLSKERPPGRLEEALRWLANGYGRNDPGAAIFVSPVVSAHEVGSWSVSLLTRNDPSHGLVNAVRCLIEGVGKVSISVSQGLAMDLEPLLPPPPEPPKIAAEYHILPATASLRDFLYLLDADRKRLEVWVGVEIVGWLDWRRRVLVSRNTEQVNLAARMSDDPSSFRLRGMAWPDFRHALSEGGAPIADRLSAMVRVGGGNYLHNLDSARRFTRVRRFPEADYAPDPDETRTRTDTISYGPRQFIEDVKSDVVNWYLYGRNGQLAIIINEGRGLVLVACRSRFGGTFHLVLIETGDLIDHLKGRDKVYSRLWSLVRGSPEVQQDVVMRRTGFLFS